MDRIYLILFIITILVIGFFQVKLQMQRLIDKDEFAMTFFERFNKYIKSQGKDLEEYTWLTYHSNKMQLYLGTFGVCDFHPPFQNYLVKNYPIILNMLPDIKKEFDDDLSFLLSNETRTVNLYGDFIREAIVRYCGFLGNDISELEKQVRNPLIWAREGIKFILSLPMFLFYQFGGISEIRYSKFKGSYVLKLLSAMVTFISFFSAVVSLVTGWENFVLLIKNILKK